MRRHENLRALISTLTALIYFSALMASCDAQRTDGSASGDELGSRRSGDTARSQHALLTPPTTYSDLPTDKVAGGVDQTVGATPFTHAVSADGAGQVSIPLWVAPGRQGMQPALALSYSSRAGNGVMGVGWQLSGLSSIARCRKTPAQDQAFGGVRPEGLCLDGMRLVPQQNEALGTTVEYRTEIDSYRKVVGTRAMAGTEFDSFTVYEPSGLILKYASRFATSHARVEGQVKSCWYGSTCAECADSVEAHACSVIGTQRRAWLVDLIADRFQNSIEIDYVDAERLLPEQIRYTAHPSLTGTKKSVTFEYDLLRPDKRKLSMAGVEYLADRRLNAIVVAGPLKLTHSSFGTTGTLRRYDLTYATHATTAQSVLAQVKECTGESPPVCKPPLQLSYSGQDGTPQFEPPRTVLASLPAVTVENSGFRVADFNGDGLDDVAYRTPVPAWRYRLSTALALGVETDPGFNTDYDDGQLGLGLVNLNRDQTTDVVVPVDAGVYAVGQGSPAAAFSVAQLQPTMFKLADLSLSAYAYPAYNRIAAIADVSGDGLPDLIARHHCRDATVNGNFTNYCRWAFALNVTNSSGLQFNDAVDFKRSAGDCVASTPGGTLTRCVESLAEGGPFPRSQTPVGAGGSAFIADIDGNGVSEALVEARAIAGASLVRPLGQSLELKAVGISSLTPSVRPTGLSSKAMPRVFLDVNGDGLVDSAHWEDNQLWVALNIGGSFSDKAAAPVTGSLSSAAAAAIALPNEMRVGDFNNDGLGDIYLVSLDILLQSNGTGGFIERQLGVPVGTEVPTPAAGYQQRFRRQWDQLLDFNGDGLVDVLQQFGSAVRVVQQRGPFPAMLQSIATPHAPTVKFSYKPARDVHTPGSCGGPPQYCLIKGMWLVSEVAVEADAAAPNNYNRQLHTYAGGRSDIRGRGWLGFETHVVVDEQTGTKVTTTYDNTTRIGAAAPFTDILYFYPGANRKKEELVEWDDRHAPDASGHKRQQKSTFTYEDSFVWSGTAQAANGRSRLTSVRVTDFEAAANGQAVSSFVALTSRKDTFAYDSYGQVTNQSTLRFEGDFDSAGNPPSSASVIQRTVVATPLPADEPNWLVRRYSRVAATSVEPARPGTPSQTRTRTTDFEWVAATQSVRRIIVEPDAMPPNDTLKRETELFRVPASGSVSTGNVTRVETKALAAGVLQTRATDLQWDSLDGTFQTRLTNPEGHISNMYFHAGFGQLAVSDDANDNRTSVYFDGFGRTKQIDVPSEADSALTYGLTAEGLMQLTRERAGGGKRVVQADKWGRLVREEETRHDNKLAVVKRTYTRLNQLATQSMPFFTGEKPEYVAFGYDKVGRLVQRTTPELDEDFWTYDELLTTHTDARNVKHTSRIDAAGRVVRTATLDGTRPVATTFEYGPFDVLDAVRGPLGHTTSNLHDLLGRTTQMIDPSAGTSTTTYNGFGEPRTVTDAAGTRTLTHDKLGRATQIQVSTGEMESFEWDTAPSGIGNLAAATMSPGAAADEIRVAYSYLGGHGRPSAEHTTVGSGGPVYSMETVWDSFDRLETQRYPLVGTRRLAVELKYDAKGTLTDLKDAATAESYWHLTAQDATGAPKQEEFGRGITTRRTFDREKRLKFLETAHSGSVVQRLVYEYGSGGLLKSRHDVPNDFNGRTTEDFEYDFLGRMSKWTVYQSCAKSVEDFTFADTGNLLTRTALVGAGLSGVGRNVVNTYGPGPLSPNAGPHAIRDATEGGNVTTYLYDGSGRQESTTGAGARTVAWNYFNLPKSITAGSSTVHFVYDAFHRRTIKKPATGESITYVSGGAYERRVGLNGTQHRFALPLGVGELEWQEVSGTITAERVAYFHGNAQGTPDAVTAQAGTLTYVQERMKHEPFGERRYASALAYPGSLPSRRSQGYTGHEADDEFGLINMRGRIYDSHTARFLSPDPYVQAPQFSQSLNRYTYVFNSPVNMVDPDGFCSLPNWLGICQVLNPSQTENKAGQNSWGTEVGHGPGPSSTAPSRCADGGVCNPGSGGVTPSSGSGTPSSGQPQAPPTESAPRVADGGEAWGAVPAQSGHTVNHGAPYATATDATRAAVREVNRLTQLGGTEYATWVTRVTNGFSFEKPITDGSAVGGNFPPLSTGATPVAGVHGHPFVNNLVTPRPDAFSNTDRWFAEDKGKLMYLASPGGVTAYIPSGNMPLSQRFTPGPFFLSDDDPNPFTGTTIFHTWSAWGP